MPALALPKPAYADAASPTLFLAIARQGAALLAFEEWCNVTDDVRAKQEGRTISEADYAAFEAAEKAEAAARAAVFLEPIATVADLRAAVEWAHELCELEDSDVAADFWLRCARRRSWMASGRVR